MEWLVHEGLKGRSVAKVETFPPETRALEFLKIWNLFLYLNFKV